MPARPPPWLLPVLLPALVALIGAALWLPGLASHGVWPGVELAALERAKAALGEPLSGLERHPWLPDALREAILAAVGDGAGDRWGLRLPGALAGIGIAALAVQFARHALGWPLALAAGLITLALPGMATGARLALASSVGNNVGELFAALAIAIGIATLHSERRSTVRTGTGLLTTALAIAAAVASSGLLFGAFVPVSVILGASTEIVSRRARVLLILASAVLLIATLLLVLGQDDGYIPLLGAAKDLELIDGPHLRRAFAGLEDYAYQTFPWAPLALVGALHPRLRWVTYWLVTVLVCGAGWSVVYGPVAIPAAIPTAVLAAGAVASLFPRSASAPSAQKHDAPRSGSLHRLAAVFVVAGVSVLAKDAARTPDRIVAPNAEVARAEEFPSERLEAPARLQRVGWTVSFALLGLLGWAALAGRKRQTRSDGEKRENDDATAATGSVHPRAHIIGAVVLGAAALHEAIVFAQVLIPEASALLSPEAALARAHDGIASGELPNKLHLHRIRDPLVTRYAPPAAALRSRTEVAALLEQPEPAMALVRAADIAFLHQAHREKRWPFFVLDDSHRDYRLVANRLPAGWEDRNTLPEVVMDAIPPGVDETLVRFETLVELVGWQLESPLIRGREAELVLVFRALRPLPASTQVYARLLQGRLSRINTLPHPLTQERYPPNVWRAGDIIVHRERFQVPVLETMPGTYDVVVGLRRSEHQNLEITVPAKPSSDANADGAGKASEPDHGVVVLDKNRNFAKVGEVRVW